LLPLVRADMRDDTIRFVDGHIFNYQAHRAFTLAYRGLGIIAELTEALWNLLDLCMLLCAHLVLVASTVLLFNSSGFFQLTQFGIPFRFSHGRDQTVIRID
jgi:hypothetical protein